MPSPRCPTCRDPVVRKHTRFFPFCNQRCKLVDLGNWLDSRYVVTVPTAFDDTVPEDMDPGLELGE